MKYNCIYMKYISESNELHYLLFSNLFLLVSLLLEGHKCLGLLTCTSNVHQILEK